MGRPGRAQCHGETEVAAGRLGGAARLVGVEMVMSIGPTEIDNTEAVFLKGVVDFCCLVFIIGLVVHTFFPLSSLPPFLSKQKT